MSQQYGLGRGLSSLIPQKQKSTTPPSSNNTKDTNSSTPRSYGQSEEMTYNPPNKKSSPKKTSSSHDNKQTSSQKEEEREGVLEVEIGRVVANSHQPRATFHEEKLRDLADSIKQHGIIQPLLVTRRSDGDYELIAGERRLRASKLAGLSKVPIITRNAPVQEKFELAILENIQRHDLSPMEEARAYRRLMDEFHLSQEDVALRIGRSRSSIANMVRFLDLPVEIQRGLEEEKITPGHAKVILGVDNPEKQRALYELILREGLTVRQTENRLHIVGSTSSRVRTHSPQDPELRASENELSEKLGTKVQVKKSGQGLKVAIDFYSQKELDSFLKKFS